MEEYITQSDSIQTLDDQTTVGLCEQAKFQTTQLNCRQLQTQLLITTLDPTRQLNTNENTN